MKNGLDIDLKYDKGIAFVGIPDLEEFLGKNAPTASTVSVPKGGFDSFGILLPDIFQEEIKKIDLDKVLSIIVPSYVNKQTASILKDFVTSSSIIEKSPEDIHGVPTYHYELNASREATKALLSNFVKIFVNSLSVQEQADIDQRLGAVTVDSFEIWIGKDDSNIHRYKFQLTAPLSKVIGLDDSGIAGNEVNLSFETSYYDFDVPNTIVLPTSSITISDFMKNIKDMKIKDAISSFKPVASNLRNALGNYGKRNNPTGSCTNPNPSSLFSPVGHTLGASTAVGAIATVITELLNTTNGALSCYSTSNDWALSAPLASDPTSSFCTDSAGVTKILTTELEGTVCK
jgi:hypothetical protein